MRALIEDAIDYSRLTAGQLFLANGNFNPEQIAGEVVEQAFRELADRPVELLCRFENRIPVSVNGDRARFKQVLTHLVRNAIKFTETGEIELSAEVSDETSTRIKLHVIVRDTGCGVPAADLPRIFMPFCRAGHPGTEASGGAGLGLAICRYLALLMMGDVWLESIPDAGTSAHFSAWFSRVAGRQPQPGPAGQKVPVFRRKAKH